MLSCLVVNVDIV